MEWFIAWSTINRYDHNDESRKKSKGKNRSRLKSRSKGIKWFGYGKKGHLIKDWYEANEEQNDKSNNQGNVSKRI